MGPTIGLLKTYSIKEAMEIYLIFQGLSSFSVWKLLGYFVCSLNEFLPSAAWMTLDTDEDIWKFCTNSWESAFQICSMDAVKFTMHLAQKQSSHIF